MLRPYPYHSEDVGSALLAILLFSRTGQSGLHFNHSWERIWLKVGLGRRAAEAFFGSGW